MDIEQLGEFMGGVSPVELLPVLVAWMVGPLIGAPVAARVAGYAPHIHGMLVACQLAFVVLVVLVTISHPVWFSVIGLSLIFPSAYAGVRLFGPDLGPPTESG